MLCLLVVFVLYGDIDICLDSPLDDSLISSWAELVLITCSVTGVLKAQYLWKRHLKRREAAALGRCRVWSSSPHLQFIWSLSGHVLRMSLKHVPVAVSAFEVRTGFVCGRGLDGRGRGRAGGDGGIGGGASLRLVFELKGVAAFGWLGRRRLRPGALRGMFGHLGQTVVVHLGGRVRPLEHLCVEYRLPLLWGLKNRKRWDAVGWCHCNRYHFGPRAAALLLRDAPSLRIHLYCDAVAGGNGVKGEGSFGMRAVDLMIRLGAIQRPALTALALHVTRGAVRVFMGGLLPTGPQLIHWLPVRASLTVTLALSDALTRQTLWEKLGYDNRVNLLNSSHNKRIYTINNVSPSGGKEKPSLCSSAGDSHIHSLICYPAKSRLSVRKLNSLKIITMDVFKIQRDIHLLPVLPVFILISQHTCKSTSALSTNQSFPL